MTYDKALKILGVSAAYGVIELKYASQTRFKASFKNKGSQLHKFDDIFWAFEFLLFFHDHEEQEINEDLEDWQSKETKMAHELKKLKSLGQDQFLKSKYFKKLNIMGFLADSVVFWFMLSGLVLPFIFMNLEVNGAILAALLYGPASFLAGAQYFTNIEGFRWSRFIQNFRVLISKHMFWSVTLLLVNLACFPLVFFRFAIAHFPLLVTYLGFSLIAVAIAQYLGKNSKGMRFLVPMGIIPSIITSFLMLGLVIKTAMPTETYSFEPIYKTWGNIYEEGSYSTTTTVVYLEDKAYENAFGIRFFINEEGFKKDSLELKFSKTIFGHKFLESYKFK